MKVEYDTHHSDRMKTQAESRVVAEAVGFAEQAGVPASHFVLTLSRAGDLWLANLKLAEGTSDTVRLRWRQWCDRQQSPSYNWSTDE